jgi:hypothetical protein
MLSRGEDPSARGEGPMETSELLGRRVEQSCESWRPSPVFLHWRSGSRDCSDLQAMASNEGKFQRPENWSLSLEDLNTGTVDRIRSLETVHVTRRRPSLCLLRESSCDLTLANA